jgi:hypothetical protein
MSRSSPTRRKSSLRGIATPFQLNASAHLGQDDDPRCHVLDGRPRHPFGDIGIDAIAFAKLGNDVGVEQEFHSLSFRPSRGRG